MSIHYEELEYTQSELDERCELAAKEAVAQFRWLSTDEVQPEEYSKWLINQAGWNIDMVGPMTGSRVVELFGHKDRKFFPVSRIAGGAE